MQEDSEGDQLLACQDAGERRKMLAVSFQKHRSRLRTMVQLRLDPLLRRRIDPSDIIQEAYLEASRRLEEYLRKRPMPFFLWVRFLTAQSLSRLQGHHLRAQKRTARREVPLDPAGEAPASSVALAERLLVDAPSPSERAVLAESRERLRAALESMDATDREVLALRYFERLSNAEAAQVLGIEKEAARKRYFRAFRRLKRILEAEEKRRRNGS